MEKRKKILIFIITTLVILLISNNSMAFDINKYQPKVEYSQEYLDWLNLDDDAKANSIMPRMHNVYSNDNNTMYNPLKSVNLMATTISSRFSLKDCIEKNMVIKNQGNLGACWTFSSLASLETNLALKDYHNNSKLKLYDFSERHLEYSITKKFLNGKINENGFNRNIGDGGSSEFATAYLTNGMGAIDEKDMPYVDSNDLIDISEIQNKKVTSQVYDIKDFPTKTSSNLEELKAQMKEHITNYGGIDAMTHEGIDCLNFKTGALYCSNSALHTPNHAILIAGWDDDYDKNNFNEKSRPTKNGAWIIKDSHGTNAENTYTYEELKKILYDANEAILNGQGITSASQISDEFVEQFATQQGFSISDGKVFAQHNDDGYLYISYEDVNIYNSLTGIEKAENNVNYDNIYQYNILGETNAITYKDSEIYLGNIFSKKTTGTEYLTQISISTPETVTCKVYVNPNGSSKNKADLQLIQLKQGECKTVDAGYHTLEFENPVKITGNEYSVVVELQGKRSNEIGFSLEYDFPDFYKKSTGKEVPSNAVVSAYKDVKIENGKCFITTKEDFEKNDWVDLSELYNLSNGAAPSGDSTIKAFTVSKINENLIKEIKITTPPTKTEYNEGEKFDKAGMVVKAVYQDETEKEISDYTIQNGENLRANQSAVTIYYQGYTVKQNITVKQKEEEPEEDPENSNFENSNLKIEGVKYYLFSNPNTQGYVLINVEVNGIKKNKANDEYKYYYYLSSNQNETNIQDWVEIKNAQITDDGKLKFEVNTKDIANYDEILNSDTIYLYVKEVVKKGNKEAEVVVKPMAMETDIEAEIYLDNEKYEINKNDNSKNDNNEQISGKDSEEKSPKLLPYTGHNIKVIILSTIIIALVGIILYRKYNLYKDIK